MISHPVIYHRDFRHDLSNIFKTGEITEPYRKKVLALLPIIALHEPFRRPLSLGMTSLRTVGHISQLIKHLKENNGKEGVYSFLQVSLGTASIGLFFFNPIFSQLSTTTGDLISNSRAFIERVKTGDRQKAIESLSAMALDTLFLASFCYGSIEITVACMMLQIGTNIIYTGSHFKEGNYFEGVCQAIVAGSQVNQAIPQLKLLQWVWKYKPLLSADLKQDKSGFTYLDIPDEYVHSLFKHYENDQAKLPPYFGPKRAGAHVSVIVSNEMKTKPGLKIEELGKKFDFRIVNMRSLKPHGWNGVNKVYFLTLSCFAAESMRSGYGFSPKISDDHDFHLTFGIQ